MRLVELVEEVKVRTGRFRRAEVRAEKKTKKISACSGKVSRCAFDKRADEVVPPSGPPEDGTPSTPPATSSSASSSWSSGCNASASSQSSISLDEEGVFAGELNRLQGGGQSYPSSLSSLSQTWM